MIDYRTTKLAALALAAALAVPASGADKGALPAVFRLSAPIPGAIGMPAVSAPVLQPAMPDISLLGQAVAPQLEALAQPDVAGEGAAAAGENIQAILQGGAAQDSATQAVPSAPGDGGGSFGPAVRNVGDDRATYSRTRTTLAAISTLWGMTFSLPQAGPSLAREILQEASAKRAVFSDIDDTLGPYNKVGAVLSSEMAQSIVAVRKAGKLFAAITDRGDFPRPNSSQKGAFESLEPVPAADRAGIIVATNGGGKIYEYDAAGTPNLIYEEPNLSEDVRAKITEAAEVVKASLVSRGTALKDENHGPFGYTMILTAGTPEATVKALALQLQSEIRARGVEFEVEGRMAKDPTLSPYLSLSKLNKTVVVRRIAALRGVRADEAVAIGDSMYKPVDAPNGRRHTRRMRRVGERLSGGPMPLTGNATDANMEKGLPGMLTLSVGGSADPNMENGYVMPGKGAQVSKQILDAVASSPIPVD